jgi:hypothetical protein
LEPQPEDADEGIEEWELSSTKLFGLSEAGPRTYEAAAKHVALAASARPASC